MYYYQIYVKKFKNTYTYSSDISLEIGTFCEIDFRNKLTIGIVIKESEEKDLGNFKIKKINKVLEDIPKLDKNILDLAIFINSYYITDFFASMKILGPYEKMSISRMENLENINYEINNKAILNEEQEQVFSEIINSDKKAFLIHGITGSGKTQIYISLIEKALREGKSAMLLVPEISLTTQMTSNIKKVFGDVSIIHSKMTISKKIKEWEKIYKGISRVVIGARSAIFAPLKNLEYIIIDEEHENTYKQEDNARYHIRNVAIKRSMLEGSKVIFSSATPSFESYYYANKDILKLLNLDKRYNNAKLPEIEIVDLNEEKSMLSTKLLDEMKEVLKKGEQVILILNRKAHSLLVKCNNCKEKISCPRCSLNLKYYKKENILSCSQCEYREVMIKQCPKCSSNELELLGVGIGKLEEELNELFGIENILRIDSTTMKSNKDMKKAIDDFKKKKYQIMIGTQMIAKGFHFPDVTLVGIINTDQILQFSDFRVGEKTFQLTIQAAGRAGRADKEGKVIIQTYNPDSKLIECIKNNDYLSYYNYEMELRKLINLSPYSRMINIVISSKKEEKALSKAEEIFEILKSNFKNVSRLDKAAIYKLNNDYRYIVFLKSDKNEIAKNRKILLKIKNESNEQVRIIVDIDPLTLN